MSADSTGHDLFGVERPNPAALLTTLAVINATWQHQGRTYLDNFVPFVVEVMREDASRSWTEADVRDRLATTFGLLLPAKVVGALLRRSALRDRVKRDHNQFTLTDRGSAEDRAKIGVAQADCRRKQKKLADALVLFANERFDFELNADAAEAVLAIYIERHAVPLLASATRGQNPDAPQGPVGEDYIIGTFVVDVVGRDPQLFEYLDQMVKGSMLASALYLNVEADIDRKFNDTTLFLDTPLILKALGFEGSQAESAILQVIQIAVRQGARIGCFEHTVKETRNILDSVRANLSSASRRPDEMAVLSHFRAIKFNPSDVEVIIGRLEQKIIALGARILPTPPHSDRLGVDEDALETLMQKRVKYAHRGPLLNDLDSLTAIHRLRGGRSQPHLERCKALLVTDNESLVRLARDFFDRREHQWPIAMVDNDLAALTWLKEPQSYPDLPRAQIVADCTAAHAPSPPLWARVSEEIDRLEERGQISEGDIALLRYSREAAQAIMDTTLGDPVRANQASMHKALDRAKAQILEPVHRELDDALARAEGAARGISELNVANANLEEGLRDSNDTVSALKETLEQREAELEAAGARRRATVAAVNQQARSRARSIRIAMLVVAVIVASAGLVSLIPAISAAFPQQALIATQVAAALALIAGLFGAIPEMAKKLENLLTERWQAKELKRLRLDSEISGSITGPQV